jgi:hypothetical protein
MVWGTTVGTPTETDSKEFELVVRESVEVLLAQGIVVLVERPVVDVVEVVAQFVVMVHPILELEVETFPGTAS